MARPAHPDAMKAPGPQRTRTAAPSMPAEFPGKGRYLTYVLFDSTGFVYLLVGLVALRVVWALGNGEAAWADMQSQLQNPLYVLFHTISLAAVIFVGVRFFGLFAKAQPPQVLGFKLPLPPEPVILATMYVAWIAVAGGLAVVLAGGIF